METQELKAQETIGKKLQGWAKDRNIQEQDVSRNGFCANITEELGEWLKAHDDDIQHEKIDSLADIVVFSMTEMIKMGFDPDLVLDETFKEIDSRTGEWSEDIQKWVKYKSPEARSKWVKADYLKCRL